MMFQEQADYTLLGLFVLLVVMGGLEPPTYGL